MKNLPKSKLLGTFALFAILPMAAQSATVVWTGGAAGNSNWSDAANWDGNGSGTSGAPGIGDTVTINNGDTVIMDLAGDNITFGVDLTLSGNSNLSSDGVVFRANNATYHVSSGSSLNGGGFWDLDGGTFNFQNGASVNMGNWEQKDLNVFSFELGAAGFTTLTPGTFRLGNGGMTGAISNATYNANMAAYTGGVGVITLVDFSSDGANMDNATFTDAATGANFGVSGLGAGLQAEFQWNDSTEAIELHVTAVPEPATTSLLGLGALALFVRRKR
ncbi:PEP-CTERM sorting domain-containing protein [Rubritalea marina]|uniref:PEP-CTERM sorting domain-containing protein n=1 Tax=Rubritalea marina TaxID=361055 RepID=UPI0003814EB5|nr:PEP-CTERM sorting domain-containing protein [Rubritalea marina]